MKKSIIINNKILNYLEDISGLEFPSALELIMVLFSTYEKGTKNQEDIELLIDFLGISNLKQIPVENYKEIKCLIREKKVEWNKFNDAEYCTYNLLHEIKNKNIIMLVDEAIIEDINTSLKIDNSTIISFINLNYIKNIKHNLI